jgi:C-terminal processing protease CtpA/Prc
VTIIGWMHCIYLFAVIAGLLAGAPAKALPADDVVAQVQQLVHTKFFDPGRVADFDAAVATYRENAGAAYSQDDAIRHGLAALHASHTDLYTPAQLDYYELLDIFDAALADREAAALKKIFPPDGLPKYEGTGIITARSSEGWYISDIYDASPAAKAGLAVGDQVLKADGHPFDPMLSFKGKTGQSVTLTVLRTRQAAPLHIPVQVITIRPNAVTDASISASVKTFQRNGRTIGYLHLWTYSTPDVQELVQKLLASAPLKDVAGLILDMRCRHGGAPADAADMFVGITPEQDAVGRSTNFTANFRYRKPLVGLIDGGTRSGMEVLADTLKKAGIVLVGTRTAGAVLGGSPFLLKDGSLLYLAVMSVTFDGKTLEGVGVSPNIDIAYTKPFSAGKDPQLAQALEQMDRTLEGKHRP